MAQAENCGVSFCALAAPFSGRRLHVQPIGHVYHLLQGDWSSLLYCYLDVLRTIASITARSTSVLLPTCTPLLPRLLFARVASAVSLGL